MNLHRTRSSAFDRRRFIAGGLTLSAAPLLGVAYGEQKAAATGGFLEPAQTVPIAGEFDVVIDGTRHRDAVVTATAPVDVHACSPDMEKSFALTNYGIEVKPCDIPLRALIARDVDGLMMAGRCLSGDFIAHSSYRVTGNSVATGQVAGIVAAESAARRRMPHDISWDEVAAKVARARVV